MTKRFISINELVQKVPYTARHIFELEKQNLFPKRIKLSPKGRTVVWLESEIDAWMNERMASRDIESREIL